MGCSEREQLKYINDTLHLPAALEARLSKAVFEGSTHYSLVGASVAGNKPCCFAAIHVAGWLMDGVAQRCRMPLSTIAIPACCRLGSGWPRSFGS